MKFFDDKTKKTTWYNRNYFYLGTILIIVINILLFYFLGNNWETSFKVSEGGNIPLDCANLIRLFMNAYSHSDWEHVLLNMLCTLICGLYIERKIGSINMLLLVLVLTPMANWTAGANRLGVNSHGFSCVVYALYAYVIIDYIFSFQKHKRNLLNTIFGTIVLVFIYVAMSWDSSKSFPFVWYPVDFIYHRGHFSGFVIGIIFSLCLQCADIYVRKRTIMELNIADRTAHNKTVESKPTTTNTFKPTNNSINYNNQSTFNNTYNQNNAVANNINNLNNAGVKPSQSTLNNAKPTMNTVNQNVINQSQSNITNSLNNIANNISNTNNNDNK